MAESRLLPLRILQVLRKHSDADHPLSQKDILALLDLEYGLAVDRGSVRRCIHELMEARDVPVEGVERAYAYTNPVTGEKESGTQYTGLWYRHDFVPSELHMLMDGVLFSRNIPSGQREDLLNRLSCLGGKYFQSYMGYIRNAMPDMPEIPQLFLNIEILDEAIRNSRQVRVEYGYLDTDFQLRPAWPRKNGRPYWIILNPYRLSAMDGRYFLLCNNQKYDTFSVFRVDRMIRCELLDTPARPRREVKGLENSPNTGEYILSNAFMGYGESGTVRFTIPRARAFEAIDFFGKTVSFLSGPACPEKWVCSVYANHYSMKKWALQNADIVKVLSPDFLAEEIRETLAGGLEAYQG